MDWANGLQVAGGRWQHETYRLIGGRRFGSLPSAQNAEKALATVRRNHATSQR
jgi:hypothetical protein